MTDHPGQGAAPSRPILVWDIYIRLFHWLLVALMGFSWWSGEQHEMEWHRLSGYAILFLLVFRLYWGFFGSGTAHFVQFVRGPRAVFAYIPSVTKRPYRAATGHNPIGGWSVMLMLATLVMMVTAGLFAVDVDGLESGPLANYVDFDQGRMASDLHGWLFNVLLALVALHVAAILYYLLRLRHNLIGPMIHGRRIFANGDAIDLRPGAAWKALIGILVAAACVYAVAF